MTNELKVAVVGPTGYAGLELTRRLFQHPRLKPPLLLSRDPKEGADSISNLLPDLNLNGNGTIHPFSWSLIHRMGVDLLFLVAPEGLSRELAAAAAEHGLLVIDLSGMCYLRSRKHLQCVVDAAIQDMNVIYGWKQPAGAA